MQVPDHLVAEIIDGELFTSPRPAMPHAWTSTVLSQDLGPLNGRGSGANRLGGWWIVVEPELHLGEDVLVPDLAAWRHERMQAIPDAPFVTLAPDWVCEVISPSTGRIDRSRKMNVYAREGVRHLWFVDPLAHTLEIYRLEDGRWIVAKTHGGNEIVHAEPFDAIAITLEHWWTSQPTRETGL